MIACELLRKDFEKTGKYRNWRRHPETQDLEIQSETALDVMELLDSRLPKVINRVKAVLDNKTSYNIMAFFRNFWLNYLFPLLPGVNRTRTEKSTLQTVVTLLFLSKCCISYRLQNTQSYSQQAGRRLPRAPPCPISTTPHPCARQTRGQAIP